MQIIPLKSDYVEEIVSLSLSAWTPVFASIQKTIDVEIYETFYGEDWRVSQKEAVEKVLADEMAKVWVAREDNSTVGFIAVKLHREESMGEIYMVAVAPGYQKQGIGTALVQWALDWFKETGMSIAMVETGGDPGHAPARHTYEKVGFELWPVARYFKKL